MLGITEDFVNKVRQVKGAWGLKGGTLASSAVCSTASRSAIYITPLSSLSARSARAGGLGLVCMLFRWWRQRFSWRGTEAPPCLTSRTFSLFSIAR